MHEWRKKSAPQCPICQNSAQQQAHRNCIYHGKLWIDLYSGYIQCDGCNETWEIEDTIHYCGCGAKYQGGEIWYGMETELVQYAHLQWVQEVGLCTGTMQTQFIGWSKQPRRTMPALLNETVTQRAPTKKNADNNDCVVATYVYGSANNPQVKYLRDFRDQILVHFCLGRIFVRGYYHLIGPEVKKLISIFGNPAILSMKFFLSTVIHIIKRFRKMR